MTSGQPGSSVLFNNMALFSGSCFPFNGILEKGPRKRGKKKMVHLFVLFRTRQLTFEYYFFIISLRS